MGPLQSQKKRHVVRDWTRPSPGELESVWEDFEDDEWSRWQRDRALLRVASGARSARRDAAWSGL
jgi:hypothetical protein